MAEVLKSSEGNQDGVIKSMARHGVSLRGHLYPISVWVEIPHCSDIGGRRKSRRPRYILFSSNLRHLISQQIFKVTEEEGEVKAGQSANSHPTVFISLDKFRARVPNCLPR